MNPQMKLEATAGGSEAIEAFMRHFAKLPDGTEIVLRYGRRRDPEPGEPAEIVLINAGEGPTLSLALDECLSLAFTARLIGTCLKELDFAECGSFWFLESKLLQILQRIFEVMESEAATPPARH